MKRDESQVQKWKKTDFTLGVIVFYFLYSDIFEIHIWTNLQLDIHTFTITTGWMSFCQILPKCIYIFLLNIVSHIFLVHFFMLSQSLWMFWTSMYDHDFYFYCRFETFITVIPVKIFNLLYHCLHKMTGKLMTFFMYSCKWKNKKKMTHLLFSLKH